MVLNNKAHLDDFFSSAVENNPMFRSELRVKRDELREIVKNINQKFTEYSFFNSDTRQTSWTIEKISEVCADCHKARLKIFEYMNEINNLMVALLS